jgi:hypothetical protein
MQQWTCFALVVVQIEKKLLLFPNPKIQFFFVKCDIEIVLNVTQNTIKNIHNTARYNFIFH